MKKLWKDACGIEVCESAIEDVLNIQKRIIGDVRFPKELEEDSDILVFRPFVDNCKTKEEGDEVLAHEVWHLIEKEKDILKKHPFIIEGTTTYAMKKFSGTEFEDLEVSVEDFFMNMYEGAASLVKYHVEGSKNPYKKMLDNNLRKTIQEELLSKVKPIIRNMVKRTLEDENAQKASVCILKQIPEFEALEGNLSAEGIFLIYRRLGTNQLEEELQHQNLDKLVDYYKNLAFS